MNLAKASDEPSLPPVHRILSIGPALDERDILLTLKLADPSSLWRALLDLQFRLSKISELSFLYPNERFQAASHLMEIGFGNDELVGGLHSYFPQKNFTNVYLSTKLILEGRQRTKPFLSLISGQLSKPTARYDYIILRAVVQKVSQVGFFISSIKKYLSPRGRVLVVDAFDPLLRWSPSIPTLDELMKLLARQQKKSGVGRTAAEKVHRRASLYGLTPERVEKLAVQSYGEVGARDFYIYFLLLSEVMVRAYGQILDQRKLVEELNRWISDPKPFAQYGLYFLELANAGG